MDGRKALFRSKLREQKQLESNNRIDSPLVRYNESDQPVCRICNLALKSNSLWPAHQASRKHHQAVEDFKANASGKSNVATNANPPPQVPKTRPSSAVPVDIFDKKDSKRLKTESAEATQMIDGLPANQVSQSRKVDSSTVKQAKGVLPEGFFDSKGAEAKETEPLNAMGVSKSTAPDVKHVKGALPQGFFDGKVANENTPADQLNQSSRSADGSKANQGKGALPEGFFDNKDADLRARGIEPVKVDINDAYKEFEKEIQDDLQGVDDRLEEEEIDAAEIREEYESLEQQQYREQVEMVKKRLIEVKAVRLTKKQQPLAFRGEVESSDESSSESDNSDENFTVDWRAKHL